MTVEQALVGYSGFVGQTLLRQKNFDRRYRSTDIAEIRHRVFDTVVCAAAPAQKWTANRDPIADRQNIEALISHLETVSCSMFILISTVDVFKNPNAVDESTNVDEEGVHPYGLNRRRLELFVESHFRNYLIVRLPGLVGAGLRKNIIFDFHNDNNLHLIDSRGVFQFYPMAYLWRDIESALRAGLRLVHLTAEPVCVADIAQQCFGKLFAQELESPLTVYDMRTLFANAFGRSGSYQYTQRDTISAICEYAQSDLHAARLSQGSSKCG